MGTCSSVNSNKAPNSIVPANNPPSQAKPILITPQAQLAYQTLAQPSAQGINNNVIYVQPAVQQQYPSQSNSSEAQVYREQQPQQAPKESGKTSSLGVSSGIKAPHFSVPKEGESREIRHSYGGGKALHLHSKTKGEGSSRRESIQAQGYIESVSREVIHPNEISTARDAHEISFTEKIEQYKIPQFTVQHEIKKVQGQHIEGGQGERLQVRENVNGVSYEVDEISQVLKSVTVIAATAKRHISEIDTKLRDERKHLKAITVKFDKNETENMDYFIYDVFRTAAYNSFNLSLESLALLSGPALQGFSSVLATNPLEKLTITHCQDDATDNFFATILSGLKRNNSSLKLFQLDFSECPQLSDGAFRHIKAAVEGSQVLEHFTVRFGKTRKITDQSIAYLKTALANKPNLKRLELGFQYMPQLTDAILTMFTDIIKSLPNLRFVDIRTTNAGYSEAAFYKFEAFTQTLLLQNVKLVWEEPTAAGF